VVPVRPFLKSETYWHFKQTGDISVASSALFSIYYKAPFPDFHSHPQKKLNKKLSLPFI